MAAGVEVDGVPPDSAAGTREYTGQAVGVREVGVDLVEGVAEDTGLADRRLLHGDEKGHVRKETTGAAVSIGASVV